MNKLKRQNDLELLDLCKIHADKLQEIYRELRQRAIKEASTSTCREVSTNKQVCVDVSHLGVF